MLALEPVVFMLNHNKVNNKSEVKWSLSGHRHSQVDGRASRRELPNVSRATKLPSIKRKKKCFETL